MDTLDRFHARLRARAPLQRFTLLVRTALAAGFVAPGLTKVFGGDFAPGIDPATPMGAYFHAFHNTGAYYGFVGAVQVLAAALLLSRRTALLGAVLYLPVVANIFVLTAATRFGVGTQVVAGLMTLACLWLLAWDAHRLSGILSAAFRPSPGRATEPPVWDLFTPALAARAGRRTLRAAYALGLAGVVVWTLAARALVPTGALQPALAAVLVAGLLVPAGLVLSRGAAPRAQPSV